MHLEDSLCQEIGKDNDEARVALKDRWPWGIYNAVSFLQKMDKENCEVLYFLA